MADYRLPPPPVPVVASAVEHAAVEPPPAVKEPPAIEPAVAPQPNPPPAPVLEADPAPAVGTVKEVIFQATQLSLARFYVVIVFYPLPVALVLAFVSGSQIFSFLVLWFWVCLGKPVIFFLCFRAIVFMLCIVLGPLFTVCFRVSVALCFSFCSRN